MIRKYGTYIKEGLKASKMTMKRRGTKIRFYLFYLVKFLSIILPFMIPVISMAEIRMSKNSINNNDIDVLDSFKSGCKIKKYWNQFMAYCLSFLFVASGMFTIAILSLLFVLLGYSFAGLINTINVSFMIVIFSIPGIVLGIIFFIISYLYFAPIPYIGDTIEDIDGADIIKKSVSSMKKGKIIIFLNTFIPGAITTIIIAIPMAIFPFAFSSNSTPILMIVCLFVIFIYVVVVLYFIPTLLLAFVNANTLLYEDIVLDDINVKKSIRGIIIDKNKDGLKNNLLNLFNHTNNSHFSHDNSIEGLEEKEVDEDDEEYYDEEVDEEEFDKAIAEEENEEVK